jgi:hypothetical protein
MAAGHVRIGVKVYILATFKNIDFNIYYYLHLTKFPRKFSIQYYIECIASNLFSGVLHPPVSRNEQPGCWAKLIVTVPVLLAYVPNTIDAVFHSSTVDGLFH